MLFWRHSCSLHGRLVLLRVLALHCLARCGAKAEALDVIVTLYRDAWCYESTDTLTLVDDQCYAMRHTLLSKAYSVRVIGFGASPEFDFREFSDDCYTQWGETRTGGTNDCVKFGGGVQDEVWAKFQTRQRSKLCSGSCSRISLAVQTFYTEANCQGATYMELRYPVQGECLRHADGTQKFTVDASATSIKQVDYPGNDDCSLASGTEEYIMTSGVCMALHLNKAQSFRWVVDRYDTSISISAAALPAASRVPWLLLSIAAAGLLCAAPRAA